MFAAVLLDDALDRPLDYAIPADYREKLRVGMRVRVPVRGGLRNGTVLSIKDKAEVARVLPIRELLSEEPLLSKELFTLAEWIARYYCAPLRKVIKAFLPPIVRKGGRHKTQLFVKPALSQNELAALCQELRPSFPSQALVLDVLLKTPKGILLSELMEKAEVSRGPIDTLLKKQQILLQKIEIDRSCLDESDYFPIKPKALHSEQQEAFDKIVKSLEEGVFSPHLIHGITGSGKTEIYLQAIEHTLTLGKNALFLVPEIALTTQMIEKLRGRFAEKIAILHHRLSDGERFDAWHRLRQGKIRVAIGARSCLFSPMTNVGLIIVDEEHESSYKQTDEAPCYHARDVAIVRAKLSNATIVLASATPSLESRYNAKRGKYILSTLSKRAEQTALAAVQIVDMKKEYEKAKRSTLFSEALLNGIESRLKIGEQVLLFLNRRGYHTIQLCSLCAHAMQCPHCDESLTFHLGDNLLACHLCDYRLSPPPRHCPKCGAESAMKFKGAGTQQVEKALYAIFPHIRCLRLDADTTRHKGSHEQLFKQFRSGKADVLIGTQMIAKGLHFPAVTLVGVLNADSALNLPDFRAHEQVFQLLTQVAGRSGRGMLHGEVIIQTALPEHTTIAQAAKQDYENFYNQEIEVRRLFCYPPFTHFIKLIFSGKNREQTYAIALQTRQELISSLPPTFHIHPAIPCGHSKVKDLYRFQLLLRGESPLHITSELHALQQKFSEHRAIRLLIDVDPLSTF